MKQWFLTSTKINLRSLHNLSACVSLARLHLTCTTSSICRSEHLVHLWSDCRLMVLHVGALGDAGKEPIFILYLSRLGREKQQRKGNQMKYLQILHIVALNSGSRVGADYLSWNCVDGMRAARRLQSPILLACHQVASSWLTTCRMSPRLKGSPASWHGVALSS